VEHVGVQGFRQSREGHLLEPHFCHVQRRFCQGQRDGGGTGGTLRSFRHRQDDLDVGTDVRERPVQGTQVLAASGVFLSPKPSSKDQAHQVRGFSLK
jgi:hypothetical protein